MEDERLIYSHKSFYKNEKTTFFFCILALGVFPLSIFAQDDVYYIPGKESHIASGIGSKTAYRMALIFAYSPVNSVFEDDNIRLEIYNETLWVINKTSKTIFIDLSQSFAFYNGQSTPLYDTQDKRFGDDKKPSKTGVIINDDLFLTIAPDLGSNQHDTKICEMATNFNKHYSSLESSFREFSEKEIKFLDMVEDLVTECVNTDPKGKKYKGVTRHLTEDESVNVIGASIAYAFNKNTEDWTTVSLTTWVCDVIFAPYYVEMPKELKEKEKRGFGAKKTQPAYIHFKADSPFEFDEDKSPLIVRDWDGDYKKGTFEINSIVVEKKKKNGIVDREFNSKDKIVYVPKILFDGTDADWGKMSYVGTVLQTGKSK